MLQGDTFEGGSFFFTDPLSPTDAAPATIDAVSPRSSGTMTSGGTSSESAAYVRPERDGDEAARVSLS